MVLSCGRIFGSVEINNGVEPVALTHRAGYYSRLFAALTL
jgi:hypothetical protein